MKNKILILITISIIISLTALVSSMNVTLNPEAAGTYSQWTGGGTTFAGLADENDNTAVSGTGATRRNQTYNIQNHTSFADDIITSINVTARCKRGASATVSISLMIKGANGLFYSSAQGWVLGTGFLNYTRVWTTDPSTGVAYTPAAINTTEIGVNFTLSNTARIANCSKIWAVVDYTVNTTPPFWSNPAKNETTVFHDTNVAFNTSWIDSRVLHGYVFSINRTGVWENSSYTLFTGTSNVSTNITQITSAAGTNVSWYFWANDTRGYSNITTTQSFIVASANTCTYNQIGNWPLICSDNCVFDTNQTIAGGNNITITGTGVMNFSSSGKWSFIGINQYITIEPGCTLNINPGGGWN